MSAMQDEVFGDPVSDEMTNALVRRLSLDDGMELWVAEADDRIISAGRLEPVRGTEFAGIWGRDTRGAARSRDQPRGDGRAGAISTADGQEAHPQRLDRVLAPAPRTLRSRQGLDDDALPPAALNAARSAQRPGSPSPPRSSP